MGRDVMIDEIYENACRTICRKVGLGIIGSPRQAVEELAEQVGMARMIKRDPVKVACEITAYLDDLVENP